MSQNSTVGAWLKELIQEQKWKEDTCTWKRRGVWWLTSLLDPSFSVRIDSWTVELYDDDFGGNQVGEWSTTTLPYRTGFENMFNHLSTGPIHKEARAKRKEVV